eukprot:17739-Heterococcus_DN1.PRE.3
MLWTCCRAANTQYCMHANILRVFLYAACSCFYCCWRAVRAQEFDESGSKGGGFLADVVEAWEAEALKAQVARNEVQHGCAALLGRGKCYCDTSSSYESSAVVSCATSSGTLPTATRHTAAACVSLNNSASSALEARFAH